MAELREPGVEKVKIPNSEPLCRVGLVLAEDGKNRMEMEMPPGEYRFSCGHKEKIFTCEKKTPLVMCVEERQVICRDADGEKICESAGYIGVEKSESDYVMEPGKGIFLKGVVAGRGFHWQKEVDLVFPYKIQFHHRHGLLIVVNILPMESYLSCVVTSEMSSECPAEFIKAQATAARSWMLVFLKNKHIGEPYTICNDDCCQRYQGTTHLSRKVARAVKECSGMCIVTAEGNICGAYYSKSCGGIMEKAQNIFGKGAVGLSSSTDAPRGSFTEKYHPVTEKNIREWVSGDFLDRMDSFCSPNTIPEGDLQKYLGAVDEAGKYFRWSVEFTNKELCDLLKKKEGIRDIGEFVDFRPGFRGNSGRLHEIHIVYKNLVKDKKTRTIRTQYAIRKALHDKFLFSTAFVWDFERDNDGKILKIILTGAGWGHGVGFCQIGALGMSLKGYSYRDILKNYYDTCSLVNAY